MTRSQYMVAFWWLSKQKSLWASLLCLFFPTGSSEQSRAVPLPRQCVMLSSSISKPLSAIPEKKILLWHLSASLHDSHTRHRDSAPPLISYPAVSCKRNCRVGNVQRCPMEKGGDAASSSWCSAGTTLICFTWFHGFFGECDLT